MPAVRFLDYTIEHVYQKVDKCVRNEITVFWLEHRALTDIVEAKRRVDEVVLTTRNPEDELVGVTTVYPATYGDDALYLHFRMFIRAQDRVPGLMVKMIRETGSFLEDNPLVRGGACGLLLCTENPKLMRPGIRRLFHRSSGLDYLGRDARGRDVWRYLFTGAAGPAQVNGRASHAAGDTRSPDFP